MEIVLRATVVFFFLFVALKALGRKELSEMSPFDMVVLIVLGDLVQQGVTQEDFSLTGAGLAGGTMIFWALAFSLLSHASARAESVIDGAPLLLLRDGEPIQQVMDAQRVTMAHLRRNARQQGIDDLADVQAAILEGEGRISFITRGGG